MNSPKCNHTILNANCKDCQELQAKWYKKLDPDEEIEDITITDAKVIHQDRLKVWHNQYFFSRHKPEEIQETLEYFSLANDLLNNYKFKSITHKKIWELHVKGLSRRETVRELANNKRYRSYGEAGVQYILDQIKKNLK